MCGYLLCLFFLQVSKFAVTAFDLQPQRLNTELTLHHLKLPKIEMML